MLPSEARRSSFFKALGRYQDVGLTAAPSLTLPSARSSVGFLRAWRYLQECTTTSGVLAGSGRACRERRVQARGSDSVEVRESGVEMIRKCLERARDQRGTAGHRILP